MAEHDTQAELFGVNLAGFVPHTLGAGKDIAQVRAALPLESKSGADRLARSLIATVHGHCTFALNGSFALLGEVDPLALAVARVKEALTAHGAVF